MGNAETIVINGKKHLLVRLPLEERLARDILFKLEELIPYSSLSDAVAWWELDEAAGPRLDATGRGNHLYTVVGDPGRGLGVDGEAGAATFDGNQYLLRPVANGDDLALGPGDFTMAGWCKCSNFTNNRVFWSWTVDLTTDVLLRVHFSSSTGKVRLVPTVTLSSLGCAVDTWYLVIADYSAGILTRTLRVRGTDGVDYADSVVAAIDTRTSTEFTMGHSNLGQPAYFVGSMQRVGKWNRLLTGAEREALWNGGRGLSWPGRVKITL